MPKNTARLLIIAGIIVVVGAGAAALLWFSGGDGTASVPIVAPTLEPQPAEDAVTFSIVPEESEVRFLLDEDLQGQRITVTGATNQIAGQIRSSFADPSTAEVGTIRINMRTLTTDNEFRNRAIRGQILRTSDAANEFSDFVPTAISGLPASVTIGEPFTFQISGDFTVLGQPRPLTFDVTVTPVSETRLEGQARAVINRSDWGLTIPSVPGVANVEEEVELEIDFVATTAPRYSRVSPRPNTAPTVS